MGWVGAHARARPWWDSGQRKGRQRCRPGAATQAPGRPLGSAVIAGMGRGGLIGSQGPVQRPGAALEALPEPY